MSDTGLFFYHIRFPNATANDKYKCMRMRAHSSNRLNLKTATIQKLWWELVIASGYTMVRLARTACFSLLLAILFARRRQYPLSIFEKP